MHLVHLSTQHNDAVTLAEDCQHRYVSCHLFRRLVSEGKFPGAQKQGPKPFKLFCDDLRPPNVLVDDEGRTFGVIDWEFTYVGPAEYTYSPPWWLLIEAPEKWPGGIDDWVREYEPRLALFFGSARGAGVCYDPRRELDRGPAVVSADEGKLGEWRILGELCYEEELGVWCEKINTSPRFFDKAGYEARLSSLSEEERDGMVEFVRRKLEERETRILHDWVEDEVEIYHIKVGCSY